MQKAVSKIGLFIWDHGGRLAHALDLAGLLKKLAKAKNVARCEILEDLWAPGALSFVEDGLRAGEFNRILWVGRFSSYQQESLKRRLASVGLNPYLQEWCDLEEQGICKRDVDPEVRNKKAALLIQMALARTRLLEPLSPVELPAVDAALVVGAGVAGLHTAVSLAELGKRVHLVEKESGVGGKVASLHRFYPRLCDPRCGLEFALHKLRESEHVAFHTLSQVKGLDGGPGNFHVRVEKRPRYVNQERCNGCGLCTSACPVEIPSHPFPTKAIHPATPMPFPDGYVVERETCPSDCRECEKACPTGAVELDQALSEAELHVGAVIVTTGWDPYPLGKVEEFGYGLYPNVISNLEMERLLGLEKEWTDLKEVGFIQCAGSRDDRHLKYCSSVCCSATLKQARYLKEKAPNARCYIFYQDIRSPGFQEDLYQELKTMDGVVFIRGNPSTVRPGAAGGKLDVRAEDTLSGREVALELDLLVLAGGMVPSAGTQEMAGLLKLPQNKYGFFEAHLQCHPEESQRPGIYTGGCCREPMNVAQSIESAHRAAVEGLSFLNGTLLVSPTYPVLDLTKCDKCKRCMEECPFSSYVFDENGFPAPDLARCRQCGNCVGTCPLVAISLRHFTIKQMAAQIQAFTAPFMNGKEPVVYAFLCENDAYHAARSAMDLDLNVPPNVVFLRLPCAGALNNALIADALAFGIDGILIAGCQDGQCHYVKGNELVRKRSDDLSDKLQKMMIERDRVRFVSLEIRDSKRYVDLTRSFVEDLKAMGPNPFKMA